MQFAILGPLHTKVNGTPIEVRRPRWRSILAYLLLHLGRPITINQLVTAIWGDHPVPTSPTQVHTAVSMLRRTFREAGAPDFIQSLPTGYRLNLDQEQLDAGIFATTLASARSDIATVADLRRALNLWRGRALEGIEAAYVNGARARLEEERLFLVEKLMDMEIERGNHRGITPELMGFLEMHPLRESLVERLLLALYHSGRKSDALREYTRVRRRLTGELGVEPGPDLRRLHQQILQDNPTVQPKTVIQSEQPSSRRRQRRLPQTSPVFTGRAWERAELYAALAERGTDERVVVCLHGPGGVGKSTLAIQVAHDLDQHFPDGRLYIDLQGSSPGLSPLTTFEILHRCLLGFGLEVAKIPNDEAAATRRYRELSRRRRLLIVLDNAIDTRQVENLVRATRSGGLIITSRMPMGLPETDQSLRLDVLSPADATSLLDRITGRAGADWAQFNQIAAYCDHLPLALSIAGQRLAREPDLTVTRLAAGLADHRDRLNALEVDGVGVRSTIRISYDLIASGSDPVDQLAADVFCVLGLLRVPSVDVEVISAILCEGDHQLAAAALARLARAQLVNPIGDGRYRPHDIIRATATDQARESMTTDRRTELIHRGIAFYAACASLSERLLRPGVESTLTRPAPEEMVSANVLDLVLRTSDDVEPWLDKNLPHLIAIAETAAESAETAEYAVTIANALSWILRKRGNFHREHALATAAVAATNKMDDPAALRHSLIQLGRVELYLGNYAAGFTHINRVLVSARADGDVFTEISAINDLSLAAIKQGDLPTAKRHLTECIELAAQKPGWVRAQVTALHNLAIVDALLGRRSEAAELLKESLLLRPTTSERAGEGSDRVLLGVICCAMGKLDEAIEQLVEGIDICGRHGDRVDTWFGLAALSVARLRQTRHLDAITAGYRCLSVARGMNQPFTEKSAHQLLALAHQAVGEPDDARTHQRRADSIDTTPLAPEAQLVASLIADLTNEVS